MFRTTVRLPLRVVDGNNPNANPCHSGHSLVRPDDL